MPRVARRFAANSNTIVRWMNVARALSSERFGRVQYHAKIRGLLDSDASVRHFFDGETKVVPTFYVDRIRRDLGPLWESLPSGGLTHDSEAYIKSADAPVPITLSA
jgi:hypothetical protein